ncbi:hypothetical protein XO10_03830 [Marinitoga sp. 1135]|uniref:Uncharacterized protein n=1 Tax=Marinitoga piezophila (strain DSM 14283 / JCM 11233 / KA3) TaxID=443254 RepID=H2J6K9_MARPK|nr:MULTISPECIES: metal-dependent hydrolase [Marinitoga]AEX85194.1 hypothetical protein Marpi_0764 [Marinitoga piezophila KA3]APT75687.1 hypothetical protein LN42_04260 [Marinitoga sp. 1137]NUU95428.1 hypothetical protein [Marinitoga sp. 1135]NUU97355.1 hypothetical protein [Marinitoga sp. 1138]
MPNFRTHVITGIILYPLYFLLFSLIADFFSIDFISSLKVILSGFFIFVLGSDLPDVDHNFSLINKFFRILLVGIGIQIVFKISYYYDFLSFLHMRLYVLKTIYIILGILAGGIMGILFNKITKHRGKWHSPITGIFLGIILYALITKNYYSIDIESVYISTALVFGFFVHLFLDAHFKES